MVDSSLAYRLNKHVLDADMEQSIVRSCQWDFGRHNEMEPLGFKPSIIIDYAAEESQILMGRTGSVAYVVFKGSRDFPFSIMDTDHMMVPYGEVDYGCRVHGDFLNTYMAMKKDLFNCLTSGEISSVCCVGHSMGGAVAALAAVDISLHLNIRTLCYTFGSPMVGDSRFAALFMANVCHWRRYAAYDDPMRFVPNERDYVHPCNPAMVGHWIAGVPLSLSRCCQHLMKCITGWESPFDDSNIEELHGINSYLASLNLSST